jgi:aerobic-type carbon monoxide dehydrogenase small subunit (CoxS/CutS family)
MAERYRIALRVNGRDHTGEAEARMTLADFLRDELGLTGTHLGCEHGVCGACTILMDGRSVRSCLLFAVQAQGHELTTVEGLENEDGSLGVVQQAFTDHHALQCGFCTPGFLATVTEYLAEGAPGVEDERAVRERISGNLCRCTGYQNIVAAVRAAAERAGA